MTGPCLCGDLYCSSCGPAQGNGKCYVCGAWQMDGGCADPEVCDAEGKLIDAAEYHEYLRVWVIGGIIRKANSIARRPDLSWKELLRRVNMIHKDLEQWRRQISDEMIREAKALRADAIAGAVLGEKR